MRSAHRTVGGKVAATARIVARDARNHPSPNGGWCESAWAGALGVQLGDAMSTPAEGSSTVGCWATAPGYAGRCATVLDWSA